MTKEKNFLLNEKIFNDTNLISELPLCKFLLMNDSNYPWFILVPRRSNIVELFEPQTKPSTVSLFINDLLLGIDQRQISEGGFFIVVGRKGAKS